MLKSGFLRKLGVPWTKCHVTQLPITWMIWEAKQLTHVDPFVGCGYLIDFDIQESKRSSNMIVLTWIQHLESWKATCQYACGSHGYTCTAHTHIYIFTYLWYLCIFLCLSLSFSLSLSLFQQGTAKHPHAAYLACDRKTYSCGKGDFINITSFACCKGKTNKKNTKRDHSSNSCSLRLGRGLPLKKSVRRWL